MRAALQVALAGLAAASAMSRAAMAQDYVQTTREYYLHQPSSYQQGCWGPCACALSAEEVMRGQFTLTLANIGNATDFYSVTNVNWRVPTFGGQPFNVTIAGSGAFTAGQVPFAAHQNMSLDLTAAPEPPTWSGVQHFMTTPATATRTIPPPVIYMQVANSATGCPGIRLWIVASWYRSDWDASGTLSVADIFGYLNAWFAGSPYADFSGAGGLEVQDIFDFLSAWFAGA